jgi:uncharacterized protein YxjI
MRRAAPLGKMGATPRERTAMGILRHRDEPSARYQMHEKLLSIGDDYWIEDDRGNRVFKVDGKAVRFRDTWILEDREGRNVAEIKEKKLSIRDAITIHVGGTEAEVKKAMVGIRDRFNVEVKHGEDLKVHGNIVDHEYEIERDGHKVAEISKKWFRARDTYGVEIFAEPDDVPLLLAVTVAVDALSHDHG